MVGLTLRLRHLFAVTGRNFVITNELLDHSSKPSAVKFALSFLDPGILGYFFVSEACDNIHNPEWDSVDLSSCLQTALSVKAVIMTFFLVQNGINTIIFEAHINFSGLIALPVEERDYIPPTVLPNQLFLNLSGNLYAFPMVGHDSVNDAESRLLRMVTKPSYDFDQFQRLLANSGALYSQETQKQKLLSYMFMLQRFLERFIDREVVCEERTSEAVLLQRRINAVEEIENGLRDQLQEIADERLEIGKDLAVLREESSLVQNQLAALNHSSNGHRVQLNYLNRAISFRTRQLIFEVADLFAVELYRSSGHLSSGWNVQQVVQSQASDTKAGSQEQRSSNPLPHSEKHPTGVDLLSTSPSCQQLTLPPLGDPIRPGSSFDPTNITTLLASIWAPFNDTGTGGTGDAAPAQQQQQQQTQDPQSGSPSLGVVAMFVRLLAAILYNQPLRHPIETTEGYSRSRIVDYSGQEVFDGGPVYPLYLSRSSLLPAYRHAIWLLTQNMLLLSPSPLGVPTCGDWGPTAQSQPPERHVVACFKLLLEKCLLTPNTEVG